jgi:myxalamid-type polyketide synthase MxaB
MAHGRHVGKIVLTMPRPVEIRGDSTWVLSGGTGAIARAIAQALVERGARHLALIARHAPPQGELAAVAAGASVRCFAADVADAEQVAAVASRVRASMPRVGGVVHLAGVLHDSLLRDLETAQIEQVLRPKVDGARILAAAFDGDAPDVYVASTSMAGWFGNQGQAAYAAANAWLDAFCQARSAAGQRSLSLAFGPWAEAGMAARMTAREQGRLRDLGIAPIAPAAGAALAVQATTAHAGSLGVLPVRWSLFVRQFGGRLPPLLRGLTASAAPSPAAGGAPGALRQTLEKLPAAQREAALRAEVQAQLAQVLGFASGGQVDPHRSFGELGVDSLLAVEIRTRLGRALDLPLPATLLFDHPDAARLTAHLLALLPAASPPPKKEAERTSPEPDGSATAEGLQDLARALEAQVRAMEERS